jgi:hypothetical protein
MKSFFSRLVFFLLIFVSLDQVLGLAFDYYYNKVKSGTIYTTNYALKLSTDDILIFGASESTHSLISKQITDSLGLSCYNLGMDGQNILYQYALFNELLNRHRPKIIIISTVILNESEKTSLSPLFPYYSDYTSIKEIILDYDINDKYKLFIKGYAYNSMLLKIIQGNITTEPGTKGYIPLQSVSKNLIMDTIPFRIMPSTLTFKYFERFLAACRENNIKVLVIAPPRFVKGIDEAEKLQIINLLERYSLQYYDFTTDTTFNNHPELFKDGPHLNHKGAIIFTDIIIDIIRNYQTQ